MSLATVENISDIQERWHEVLDQEPVPATDRDQSEDEQLLYVSDDFEVAKGRLLVFILKYDAQNDGGVTFGIRRSENKEWLRYKTEIGAGKKEISVSFYTDRTISCHLAIEPNTYTAGSNIALSDIQVHVIEDKQAQDFIAGDISTYLPHWNAAQRKIHDWCREYSWFNGLVAQWEMRRAKEEILSLPQFMSFCPTGQCNASCEFCSVTVNRTGVIKRQLPMDRIRQLVAPVAKVVRMYGLEGNGEPTLYKHFDELNDLLRKDGANVYLITNGAMLREDQLPDLMGFESINFSLNAATAETHKKVMRLKNFDHVIHMIKSLAAEKKARGLSFQQEPHVSASFVVTNDSIHEVADFILKCDEDLGVSKIYIRPLSEIATELGANEDFRDLVPYENDVVDALDEVEHVQQKIGVKNSVLNVDPSTFRAVRPDPVDRLVYPKGFEGHLLLPREKHWTYSAPISAESMRNVLNLDHGGGPAGERLSISAPIPVPGGESLTFNMHYQLDGSPLRIAFVDASDISNGLGKVIAEAVLDQQTALDDALTITSDNGHPFSLAVSIPDDVTHIATVFYLHEAQPMKARLGVERFRTPGRGLRKEFKLPHPGKWEMSVPGVGLAWEDSKVSLEWHGKPGPYLLKNFSVETFRNEEIDIPVKVNVESGKLVIGVLSEDFSKWEHKFTFEEGTHDTDLTWNTGENRRVQLVMFSAHKTQPLKASVDWGKMLEPLPDRFLEDQGHLLSNEAEAAGNDGSAAQVVQKDSLAKRTGTSIKGLFTGIGGFFVGIWAAIIQTFTGPEYHGKQSWLHALLWGRDKFFCQKPWTDLNNFSVDGRVDVCCIATGPSQAKYQWGNLLFQNFQEVWNGTMAKEFRRTVNGKEPLPPCARCPMSKAFQGPFFSHMNTLHETFQHIMNMQIGGKKLWQLKGGRRIGLVLYAPCHLFIQLVVMRGFKRDWGWKQVTFRG